MNKILCTTLLLATSILQSSIPPARSTPPVNPTLIAQEQPTAGEIQQKVQQIAKNITVRITAENNGGSGVLIAQKGDTYLILTNAHVVRRATQIQVQAPDGRKYTARRVDGGFSPKYDLALLEIQSKSKYQLPDLSDLSTIAVNSRNIYTTGYPFDSNELRITGGQISQLSDIPFDDGTQIGYAIDKGKQGIRQGMSGGPIFDASGHLLGITTIGAEPILPDYTYNDGSKPIAKLAAKYREANWGIPIYNFLINVKADILYGYDNLPKVEPQVTPTGYLAKLNVTARQMTVRIENSGGNGSGAIVAKSGNNRDGFTYYVLTAKHVVDGMGKSQIVTYDQDRHPVTNTVVATGVDLAVMKFSSRSDYPVGKLNTYSPNQADLVFVGGFPGREKINSPLWQWQLNPGFIYSREQGKLQTQNKLTFADRYDLLYSSMSYGGMSGGPVLDRVGNIIGIHGKAESENLNSAGISIQTFTGLLQQLQVDPKLLSVSKTAPRALSAQEDKNVLAAMENIPKPEGIDPDGRRALAYGTQLFRVGKYPAAVAALKIAVAKGQVFSGNYRLAMALFYAGEYRAAATAIDQAIAVVINDKQDNGKSYYLWKLQSAILRELKNYSQALVAINRAIAEESRDVKNRQVPDVSLHNEKGNILSELGNKQGAIDEFTLIITRQPEAYAYNNRGLAKSALGQQAAAIADYDRAIAIAPQDSQAYYNRGVAKSDLGQKAAAIADFDRAIAIAPQDSQAYNNRGSAKSDLGQKAAAIADFARAIAINPKYAQAYYNRGVVKSELGDKAAAIADYDRAITINPQSALAYNNRGVVKSALGQKAAAIADFDRAIAINSQDAQAYNNRGVVKSALGDKAAAVADYDRAIAINPQFAQPYYNRGVIKSDLGHNTAAITDFDRAIAINSQDAQAYNNRGIAKYALGQKAAAIADYDRAIVINPKDTRAYNNRGIAKFDLGQKTAGIADFDRAIAIDPQFALAYYNRGNAKSDLGQNTAAIADYDRAIAINSQDVQAYYNRGIAKFDLGQKAAAIADYDRAIAINPKFAQAYNNRGNAKSDLGQKAAAIQDVRTAAELFRQQGQMDLYQRAIDLIGQLQGR
jgi:tetratricopeptide (TPR) repeat protein/S1-C subfamily serine protease